MPADTWSFSTFALDIENSCLLRDGTRISLSPKDCALLRYLAMNPGRVISHSELLSMVWRETAVGPDVLKVRIARLRRLLGDSAASPRFIANIHGEGYRFLEQRRDSGGTIDGSRAWRSTIVGRNSEVAMLESAFTVAAAGRRHVLFITGDAGIGKTALIDRFVERLGGAGMPTASTWGSQARVGRGQCIEHYGSGEPYLPVLEALGRLARGDERGHVTRALRQHAPSWLLHLPSLLGDDERQSLHRQVFAPTQERMLRELADALETPGGMAAVEPAATIVLILEDLHWADASTLDLIRMLARRREPARLLVVGSYRPVEAASVQHPLRGLLQELHAQETVAEIALGPLGAADVADYLAAQCPGHGFPARLAELLHQRTEGHPLFLRDIVRDLRARAVIVPTEGGWEFHGDVRAISAMMPGSIRQLFDRERDGLTVEDQRVLEAASIAGAEFSAAAAAGALEADIADVEDRCLRLAERQMFIRSTGTDAWPDGTHSMRFAFIHASYRELWQERIGGRRAEQWHLRVAERREAACAGRAHEIAPELASHFEQARLPARAIAYRELASGLALQRAAHTEARWHLDRALALLPQLTDESARLPFELRLHIALGSLLALTGGYGSPDAALAFQRAHAICHRVGQTSELVDSAFGVCRFFWTTGQLAVARDIADQMAAVARSGSDPVRRMAAHAGLGTVLFVQGELAPAIDSLKAALELARVHWRDELVGTYGSDLPVVSAGTLGNVLQITGFADQALRCQEEAVRFSRERSHPIAATVALWAAALFHQFRRDPTPVQNHIDAMLGLGPAHQLAELGAWADVLRGWARIARGRFDDGSPLVHDGVDRLQAMGAAVYEPIVLGILADARLMMGDREGARRTLDAAFAAVRRNGPGLYDAELHRLEGEFHGGSTDVDAAERAERSFERAIAVARAQGAKLWELRATLGLAGLQRQRGNESAGHAHVSQIYDWFTEGFEIPDLKAARAFLDGAQVAS